MFKRISQSAVILVTLFIFARPSAAVMTLEQILAQAQKLLKYTQDSVKIMDQAKDAYQKGNIEESDKLMNEILNRSIQTVALASPIQDDLNYYSNQSLTDAENGILDKISGVLEENAKLSKSLENNVLELNKEKKEVGDKESAMRMLKTVYSAVESYYLLNNVYPAALEEISESMLSFKDTLRGIAENSLFDLKYSRSDATHYELTVTPKPELVSEGKVSSETYLFDNRDGKVTLKDASGAVLERLSLN